MVYYLAILVIASVFFIFVVCSSQCDQSAARRDLNHEFTPEQAKEALLEFMRSDQGINPHWPEKFLDDLATLKLEERENGWYYWTGEVDVNPSTRRYHLIIGPDPRDHVRMCTFEYRGSFVWKNGPWQAMPPVENGSALGDWEVP